MAHDCPTCGQACYCDCDDTWFDDPPDCTHDCDPQDLDMEEDREEDM